MFILTHNFMLLIFLSLLLFNEINSKLVYLSQVYRHGARYPYHDFYDYNETKQFAGTLTSIGLREHFLLGSYIQDEYVIKKINQQENSLLSKPFKAKEVELFTLITEPQRCQQSAYAQAQGLFPFFQGETIADNFNPKLLQPPFQTIFPAQLRLSTEIIYEKSQNFALEKGFQSIPIRYGSAYFPECLNQNEIFTRRSKQIARQMSQFEQQQMPFIQKMQKIFKLSSTQCNLHGLKDLADVIIADKWLDRSIPDQFTEQDFNQLYFIRGYQMTNLYSGQVAKIYNAPFINTLLNNMKAQISQQINAKKLSTYSTHDLNIIPLLVYYNITSAECQKAKFNNASSFKGICVDPIPFASNLIFELHQNDNKTSEYFVKLRYNGVYYKIFDKTETFIQFNQFAKRSLQNLLDFQKQCCKPSNKLIEQTS